MTRGCARDREAELKTFFSDPKRDRPGIQPALRRMADAMEECSNLHDREAERVERWLKSVVAAP